MNTEFVNPELLEALATLPKLDYSTRLVRVAGRLAPRLMRTPQYKGLTIRTIRESGLRARIYVPQRSAPGPGLLWIHGGGLVTGTAQQDDKLCAATAHRLGITVVSVEYRVAPQAPFPAALDDVLAAWQWLQKNGEIVGIDPQRVAVGGESAGAGIAASLVHRLHDAGGTQPVAQWLFAPMLDDRTAGRHELDAIDHAVWNNEANRFGWSSYLGQHAGLDSVAQYSVPARRENLTGLPQCWLYAGDIELLHDEIAVYAERIKAAGVPVEFEVVPGAAHGFENWASTTELAQSLITRAQNWLALALGLGIAAS